MSEAFDIYTLLFLVLAVVIFLRLRNVLGRRTGSERPPYDPYSPTESQKNGAGASAQDNVVTLQRDKVAPNRKSSVPSSSEIADRIQNHASPESELYTGLSAIAKVDSVFEPEQFIQGAKTAYEMIVMAFAEGNKRALKPLLNKDVYEGFASAIDEREKNGEIVDSSFVGIDKSSIIEADLKNKTAQVTIKFVSEIITAVRNKSGEVINGDPKKIIEVTDIWTFAREVTSGDPNWKLIATQSAN